MVIDVLKFVKEESHSVFRNYQNETHFHETLQGFVKRYWWNDNNKRGTVLDISMNYEKNEA